MGFNEFFISTALDKIYVQSWFESAEPSGKPVILVHGGSHTGVVWTSKPNRGPGLAQFLVQRGWDVFVVDWPGVGRSGYAADYLTMPASRIVDGLAGLLAETGPAMVIGHSIGATLAFQLAEREPNAVAAIVALAPAPIANTKTHVANVPVAPLDRPVMITPDAVRLRFANSPRFPIAHIDEYIASLVPYSPNIRNAAVGANADFVLESTAWTDRVPVLLLSAELDKTTVTAPTAAFLGVENVLLGKDWGLPDHGHLFPIEDGCEEIFDRIERWMSALPISALPTESRA